MELRIIKESELDLNLKGRHPFGFITVRGIHYLPTVKVKKITIKRNKKTKEEFYGELVNLENYEGIKLLVPLEQTTEYGQELRLKRGKYFLGKYEISLSNPRKLLNKNVILYDIEYLEKQRWDL